MVYSVASLILITFVALLGLCAARAFSQAGDKASRTTSTPENVENSDTTSAFSQEDTETTVPEGIEDIGIQGIMSHEEGSANADNLQDIKGVGPKLEGLLHSLGIYTFAQIAAWSDDDVQKVDNHLKFSGRIKRDDWISQAKDFS